MDYKMYLLNIGDFADPFICKSAMKLLDDCRLEAVFQRKREKDRMCAIAAGLLLQAGFREMEFENASKLSENIFELTGKSLLAVLQYQERLPITYTFGAHGKPQWEYEACKALFPDKKMWHFNLSHSGDYVVLVIADREVGVDLQQARKKGRITVDYRAFSRMEAVVKCSGDGYAAGYEWYRRYNGAVPGYQVVELNKIDGYAWYLCLAL